MTQTNQLSKTAITRAFNRCVATYDEAAALQREVGQRLLNRLELIRLQPFHLLDLGCGTGRLTAQLEKRYPKATLLALDLAYQMVRHAKQHARWFTKQRFICADAECLPIANQSVDFVVSNMMLHWCLSLDSLFQEIHRILKPGGLFMFTTVGPDTLKELRASWQQIDADASVHLFMDMHDIGDKLLHTQFSDPVLDIEYFTLTYPDIRRLFSDLKKTGEQSAMINRCKGLTGKRRFQQFVTAYECYRSVDGLLPATYEVIYGHAWKSETTTMKPIGGEVQIPINQIGRVKYPRR